MVGESGVGDLQPIARDLDTQLVAPLLEVLSRANERVVSVARANVAELDRPSALDGWSRLMVLAHLRYVASAIRRMTEGALVGRSEPMYPGGRASLRPHTIVPAAGESAETLVASLHTETTALDGLWQTLSMHEWQLRIGEPDHGVIPLSQLLVLRLTETQVHGTDLGFAALDAWDELFVEVTLPLRLAWLERARHRADADLTAAGSWLLTDRRASWLVVAGGRDVHAYVADAGTRSDCRLTAGGRDLLALLMGRPPERPIERSGNVEFAAAFKRAFPGP